MSGRIRMQSAGFTWPRKAKAEAEEIEEIEPPAEEIEEIELSAEEIEEIEELLDDVLDDADSDERETVAEVDLSSLSKKNLLSLANEAGVLVKPADTKKHIINMLQVHQALD